MTKTIHFADGTQTRYADNRDAAVSLIARKYDVAVSDLVTDDSGERELVWLSESDADNDDGANAVAEIVG